jgi:hypothetical protein
MLDRCLVDLSGKYWLTQLTNEQRQAAVDLRDRFAALGAREPEDWAGSEIREGIAQLARFLVLRDLWAEAVDGWTQPEALEGSPLRGGCSTPAPIGPTWCGRCGLPPTRPPSRC